MSDKNSNTPLDDFYTPEFILQKERFYGVNYSSLGGEKLLLRAGLQPAEKVIDICCGQGGAAMYMARHYGVHVHGVELSQNLINLGKQRLAACETVVKNRVQLEHAAASTVQLRKNYYDIVYSKDSINYIHDKETVYENIMSCLRPSGRLFISDWCNGDGSLCQPSITSLHKINLTENLITVSNNIYKLKAAGFKNVKAEDLSKEMIIYIENSLTYFKATKKAFIKDFDSASYQAIEAEFKDTVTMLKEGTVCWVLFTATVSE